MIAAAPTLVFRADTIADPSMASTTKRPRGAPRPTRTCQQCGRPFEWRKKWERDWDQVKFCSDACRRGGVPRRIIDPS